jgi:hypothetical protein
MMMAIVAQTTLAQMPTTLSAPQTSTDGQFGKCMAVSNNYLLIGASTTAKGNTAGEVYIADLNKGNIIGTLPNKTPLPNAHLGWCMAANKQNILVAAPFANNEAGLVQVYSMVNDKATFEQTLPKRTENNETQFGKTMAVTDNTALIAVQNGDDGYQSGAVYAYRYQNKTWTEEAKITPRINNANANFGHSLVLPTDNEVFIGAYGANKSNKEEETATGAVYYYQYINKKWQEQQKITDNNAQIAAKFGWAIAADNNWLAIAAPSAGTDALPNVGKVCIYAKQNNQWVLSQTINPAGEPIPYAAFGKSLALFNNKLFVGAGTAANSETVTHGIVYTFAFDEQTKQWLQQDLQFVSPTPLESTAYGNQLLALPNNQLLINAYSTPINNTSNAGKVYAYTIPQTTQPIIPQTIPDVLPTQTVAAITIPTKETALVPTETATNTNSTTTPANQQSTFVATQNMAIDVAPLADKLPTAQLNIYPNPSQQGVFYVQNTLDFAADLHMQVSTQQGSPIKATYTLLAPNKLQIQLQNAPAGMYLLQLNNNNQQSIHKLYVTQP